MVLFCVKAYDADDAAKLIKPMIGKETSILPVLNGVDHIDLLNDHYGSDRVLGGVAAIIANLSEPGVIKHSAYNSIIFGETGGSISSRGEQFQELLTVDGMDVELVPNIVERMWWKFAFICGLGVFTVMRGDKEMIFGFESTQSLIRQAIAEVIQVAQVKGISLSESMPDDILNAITDNFPPTFKPSSLVDLERGNRLEIEALNGALSCYGKDLKVHTPINDFIYACLKPYIGGTK